MEHGEYIGLEERLEIVKIELGKLGSTIDKVIRLVEEFKRTKKIADELYINTEPNVIIDPPKYDVVTEGYNPNLISKR